MEFNFHPFECRLVLATMEQQQAMEREKEVILLERKKLGRHHTLQVIKINIINSKPY